MVGSRVEPTIFISQFANDKRYFPRRWLLQMISNTRWRRPGSFTSRIVVLKRLVRLGLNLKF